MQIWSYQWRDQQGADKGVRKGTDNGKGGGGLEHKLKASVK